MEMHSKDFARIELAKASKLSIPSGVLNEVLNIVNRILPAQELLIHL